MPDAESMRLNEEQSRRVRELVSSGRYASAADVVEDALSLLDQREAEREEIRRKIQEGLDDVGRGDTFDGEEVFAELDRLIEDHSRRNAG